MTTNDDPVTTVRDVAAETVELYVPNQERPAVARLLLAAADHPRDVVATSNGFIVPGALYDRVYGPRCDAEPPADGPAGPGKGDGEGGKRRPPGHTPRKIPARAGSKVRGGK